MVGNHDFAFRIKLDLIPMRPNDIPVRKISLGFLLALSLISCLAKNLGAHLGASPLIFATPLSTTRYVGTTIFDLIDTQKNKHKSASDGSKSYYAAFTKMTEALVNHDRRFIDRITSGPSTKGIAAKSAEDDAVVHVTCQAHACNQAVLAVMFVPRSGRMVALLWDQCVLTELGNPTPAESEILSSIGKVPLDTQEIRSKCGSER